MIESVTQKIAELPEDANIATASPKSIRPLLANLERTRRSSKGRFLIGLGKLPV
jgi:hypothetical protein